MDISDISTAVERLDGWTLSEDGKSIQKSFERRDFSEALALTNRIGALAEAENHHPDIALSWGKVGITLSTHSEGGVTEKDLSLAEKINAL